MSESPTQPNGSDETVACPSIAKAVLGAMSPDGAWLRCGGIAGHEGDHQFRMDWHDGVGLQADLDAARADMEFMARLKRRIAEDRVVLQRLTAAESERFWRDRIADEIAAMPRRELDPGNGSRGIAQDVGYNFGLAAAQDRARARGVS